ncbi:hypothetical protein FNW25_13230 [Flavobacterium franklandianum]|uniref:Cytochrome c domain-containing protein n=1 Tax=Flavobacterium franklandianum TaxID=2594430 RepID=A0A553C6F3_9FLAO|nr:hypothetical protein FNW17_14975 [Flavobacterium franklandianum]TRX23392.1 hypothetical protein FNW25_13230 [Flavobacterium franklandianum]
MKISILIFITCCIGFSCETSTYDEVSGEVANPTYTANVKSIINNNCLGCHSDAAGQYPTMETYVQVRNATENGKVICRIDDQSCGAVMPQSGRMPQVNINTIKKWVANGFPN